MKKSTRMLLVAGPALAAGLAIVFFAPATQLFFRLNHLRYLVNDHQYANAILEWERTSAQYPAARERLPDFERGVIRAAIEWYSVRPVQGPGPEKDELDRFLQLIREGERAPLGRRLKLNLSLRKGEPTETTLAIAREILANEGYDAEAIWWAVRTQYDPKKPLEAPAELLKWREEILRPPAPGTKLDEREAARNAWLRALVALSDRNWAQAAELLENYCVRPEASPEDRLALGRAMLEAGHLAEAVTWLDEYLKAVPGDDAAIVDLARAHLGLENYAWAAATIDRLRAIKPDGARRVFEAHYGPAALSQPDPFAALTDAIAGDTALGGKTGLLWMMELVAATEPQRTAVARAANRIIALPAEAERHKIDLLNLALARGDDTMGKALAASLDQLQSSATLAVKSVAAAAQAIGRSGGGLGAQVINLFWTNKDTKYVELDVPANASLIVFRLEGHARDNIWPMLHVDLAGNGAEAFYAAALDRPARSIAMKIPFPQAHAGKVRVAISLLNASEDGRRDFYINEANFY